MVKDIKKVLCLIFLLIFLRQFITFRTTKQVLVAMSTLKYFSCIVLLALTSRIYSQDQSIYIFDPSDVSTSFQYTLSQLTEDSVFVADSLDDSIFNYDAAFLFINYPYILSEEESNRLIQYTSGNMPAYIFTGILPSELDSIAFWNHIGVADWSGLLLSVPIDTVFGVSGQFTEGIIIDTSFMSGLIPVIIGNVDSILIGDAEFWEVNTTFISGYDSLKVIIDLYNLIDDEGYLRRVLEYFELIPQQQDVQINFFPPVDTAWIFGGCTGPDIITHNLTSTQERDSITIEPGLSSYFFYYDSLGNQILVDKYYFIVEDSLNQYDYELWFHPKSWPPFDPILISFDSVFYFQQYSFDIQLVVKLNGVPIDSLSQFFRADWGLNVDGEDQIPDHFSLYQNYPNPFNPSTKIKYSIPSVTLRQAQSDIMVTLNVYDILGNEIVTLVNEEKSPGTYEVEFSAKGGSTSGGNTYNLTSGIYFYQLKAGNFVETNKMILLK
jgi:hypothetical protein